MKPGTAYGRNSTSRYAPLPRSASQFSSTDSSRPSAVAPATLSAENTTVQTNTLANGARKRLLVNTWA